MISASDTDDVSVRDRVSRLFQFVRAIYQLRNPVQRHIRELTDWTLSLEDLPAHPCITLNRPEPESNATDEESTAPDVLLRVERPSLRPIPPPPPDISDWVEDGWQKYSGEARYIPSRQLDTDDAPKVEPFDADPTRVEAFSQWNELRRLFLIEEKPAIETFEIFSRLYQLRGALERDAERYEVVLGDGILSWRVESGSIRFPLVLQRLELEFDPTVPAFTLTDAELPTEFNSALLRSISSVDGSIVGAIIAELVAGQYHPLMGENLTAFLKSISPRLASTGRFADEDPVGESADPVIYRAPLIFVRKRTFGFATALESILADLQQGGEIAQSLQNIVGLGSLVAEDGDLSQENGTVPYESPEDILFTLEANEEQFRIAETLARHSCVLVQGPPGTGKTHTIANIIGHLLAQGKSILVTSATTKALRVLREKIVADLQPLCVSVLESDSQSNDQLKASVDSIVDRLGRASESSLSKTVEASERKRAEAVSAVRHTQKAVLDARLSDSLDLISAGESLSPIKAAKLVAECINEDGWIPGTVSPGVALTLSPEEIRALYRTNKTVPASVEREIASRLPDPELLPSPQSFADLVEERASLFRAERSHDKYWNKADVQTDAIAALIDGLQEVIASWRNAEDWLFTVGADGFRAGGHGEAWKSLFSEVEAVEQLAAESREIFMRLGPSLANNLDVREQHARLTQIVAHLEAGGNVGWFSVLLRGQWREIIDKTQIAGRGPKSLEEYRALYSLASLELARESLRSRWQRQVVTIGGPDLPPRAPEDTAGPLAQAMSRALEWYHSVFVPYNDNLVASGFLWSEAKSQLPPGCDSRTEFCFLVRTYINEAPVALQHRSDALRLAACDLHLQSVEETLKGYSSEVVERLRTAVRSHSAADYRAAYSNLVALHGLTSELEKRRAYLEILSQVAPEWADAIAARVTPHDADVPPGDIATAWRWRQYAQQLEERDRARPEELEAEYAERRRMLHDATADLVDAKAWLAQRRRTGLPQQQALIGWQQTVKKIGKGTGKRVPRLRKVARQAMDDAKSAVPVWVMPLIRVAENYDPRTTKFDVVIIDEASQSDVTGLIALYYGRQIVVVGDDEQVSPDAVGQRVDEVQHLIDEFLFAIPNAELLDGRASIYDLAKSSFGGAIALREHFRCVPAIIAFSNHLSYKDKMVPLREAGQSRLLPHVVAHRVNGTSDEKINEEEAYEIASLVIACLQQPEYSGKSLGVISLVGEDQARLIETLLLQNVEPSELEDRRLLCGNSAQFQGDERDVIFLSMVDSPRGIGPLPKRDQPAFQKRFNVAASRARDQMWLVYSLDPSNNLQPDDLRRRLIEHALNPDALSTRIEIQTRKADSDFERDVLRRLITAGYKATAQYHIGAYRVDIMVEGSGSDRLAVECDGEQYHTILDLEHDLARQAILQRVGLTFHRIRGGKYYRDADKEFAHLVERLSSMGIEPYSEHVSVRSADEELRLRVIARAQEIRQGLSVAGAYAGSSRGRRKRQEVEHSDAPVPTSTAPPQSTATADSLQLEFETKESASSEDHADHPHSADRSTDLLRRLVEYGFAPGRIIDKRGEERGSLWVIADASHRPFFDQLRRDGFRFEFAEHGGRSTHHQPGWYSRNV